MTSLARLGLVEFGIRTTPHVFCVRHGLKMCRVHAGAVPTEMIQLYAFGERTKQFDPKSTMSHLRSHRLAKHAVAKSVAKACPLPASCSDLVLVDLQPEVLVEPSVMVSHHRLSKRGGGQAEGVSRVARQLSFSTGVSNA